jgi:hypothetical protein
MSDPLRWTVVVEPDQIAQLRAEVEWALQHTLEQFTRPRVSMRRRQRLVAVMAAVMLAAVASVWWSDRSFPHRHLSPPFVGAAVVAVVALIAIPFMPRYFAYAVRLAAEQIARRAGALIQPIVHGAPIEYVVADGRVTTNVGNPHLRGLALSDAREVFVTPQVVAIRHGTAARLLFVPAPAADHPVVAELARAGATITAVTGPVERYGAWTQIPGATVRQA